MSTSGPEYRDWTQIPQNYELPEYDLRHRVQLSGPGRPLIANPRDIHDESTEQLIGRQAAEDAVRDNVQQAPALKRKTFRQKYLSGLKVVLRAWAALSAIVLIANVAGFACAVAIYGTKNGYGIIQQGDCATSQTLNLWLHLAINVLSTGLFLASTAFMTASMSPSRAEILQAHSQRKWLSVGLLSFRNIPYVSWKKSLVCALLALTSLPVHLVYNSVIFPSLSTNNYYAMVVTEKFLSGAPFNINATFLENEGYSYQVIGVFDNMQNNAHGYEQLDNENCIKAYGQKLVSDRQNLVLVSSANHLTNSILVWFSTETSGGYSDPKSWICSIDPNSIDVVCDTSTVLKDPNAWTLFNYPILYCLSERSEGSCSVKFSSLLALVVIVCNVLKLATEVYILFSGHLDDVATGVGDAMASFLVDPDPNTRNMCLIDNKTADGALKVPSLQHPPRQYAPVRRRWGGAVTRKRWTWTIIAIIVSVIPVLFLLPFGIILVQLEGFNTSAGGLWQLGFGTINPEIVLSTQNFGTVITVSLLANTPQLVLAIVYYFYNGILVSIFTAREYCFFAFETRHLRVATPAGDQLGPWLLGMPFGWGIAFNILQTLLHWLISQSLFVVDILISNENGMPDFNRDSILNCGFSPLAVTCALVVILVMFLAIIILGLIKLPRGSPPLAGNCSAAITAACHWRSTNENTPYMALKWGCTEVYPDGVGHCSFAPAKDDMGNELRIDQPREGLFYC